MWELYDQLIAGIPKDLQATKIVAGNFWTCVRSELGTGVAGTVKEATRPPVSDYPMGGVSVRKLAELAKSWNLVEASIGVAAINSYYNTPEVALQNGVMYKDGDQRRNDPYIAYRNYAKGKKIGCIGSHTGLVDSMLKDVAEVTSFGEAMGDYPMSAVEDLLPKQDLVYLPCYSETTKELPRYLALSSNAISVICGPSITMSPVLFEYGVEDMAGLVIINDDLAMESVCGTAVKKMFAAGKKASLRKGTISL